MRFAEFVLYFYFGAAALVEITATIEGADPLQAGVRLLNLEQILALGLAGIIGQIRKHQEEK